MYNICVKILTFILETDRSKCQYCNDLQDLNNSSLSYNIGDIT